MSHSERHGLTIVELLVALSVIALLIAITVPAVQSARESSRRMQCQSQLKQFGTAIHGFEAANRAFPPAQRATTESPALTSVHYYAPHVYLLGYFDQGAVASAIDTSQPQFYTYDPNTLMGAARSSIPVFQCPSDPNN